MTNIYNKGIYRGGEWAKHLRPYLKMVGNRRWRRTSFNLERTDLEQLEISPCKTIKIKDSKNTIKVKFTIRSIGDRTYSYKAKYRTLRSAQDAIKRNNVLRAKIIN